MNKFQKLHITIDSIHELNHFIYMHSLKIDSVGTEYKTTHFHESEYGVEQDPWKYAINTHGYRGNNWSFNKESIAFFGCSFTFGIGVKKSITESVQEKTGVECINLGSPGASSIAILKTFISFIKLHPIKYAVITLPANGRIYHPTYDNSISLWHYGSLIPGYLTPHNENIYKAAYKFFTEDVSAAYLHDYINFAEELANHSGTKILWSSWDTQTQHFLNNMLTSKKIVEVGNFTGDKARDNMHPGPKVVENWAVKLTAKLKEYFLKNIYYRL